MTVAVVDFANNLIAGEKYCICECCAAYLTKDVTNTPRDFEVYFTNPKTGRWAMQYIPSKGISVGYKVSEADNLLPGEVIDVIDLGDNEKFYIRSALEEFHYE